MKHNLTGWLIGGLITASVLGLTMGVGSVTKAAEQNKPANNPGMMEMGGSHMGSAMNPDIMNTAEMQTKCTEMMADSQMQQNMKQMMQQPQMQSMMKQMLANDPEFKHMMNDVINSPSSDGNTAAEGAKTPAAK